LELFSIFKVLLKKAVHVENISEKRENCTTEKVGKQANCNSSGALEPATYILVVLIKLLISFRMDMSKM